MYGVKLYKKYYSNSICNFRSMQKMTTNKLLRILGKDNMFKALYTPNHVEKDVMNEKKQYGKILLLEMNLKQHFMIYLIKLKI